MSVHAISWVQKQSKSRLGARCVAIVLADHADTYGKNSYPTIGTIAAEANVSRREAQYGLRELEDLGEIMKTGATPSGVSIWEFPGVSDPSMPAKIAAERSSEGGANRAPQGAQSLHGGANPAPAQSLQGGGANPAPQGAQSLHRPLKDEPSLINHPVNRLTSDSDSGKKKKRPTGDERFDDFWSAYPKRSGGNSKAAALQRFVCRVKNDRVDPEEIIAAAEAYGKYCDATCKTGTEYVMHAETFLSPTKRGWEQDWSIPEASGKNGHARKTLKERSDEISRRMAEKGL